MLHRVSHYTMHVYLRNPAASAICNNDRHGRWRVQPRISRQVGGVDRHVSDSVDHNRISTDDAENPLTARLHASNLSVLQSCRLLTYLLVIYDRGIAQSVPLSRKT